MSARVLFRCDASVRIGGGHVMRCLTLAQAFAWAGWDVCFAVNAEATATVPALACSGYDIIAEDTMFHHLTDDVRCVVIDHYDLGHEFETACRGEGRTIAVLEDWPHRRHDCDVLVDPTPLRQASDYSQYVPQQTHLALGASCALVSQRWLRHRPYSPASADPATLPHLVVSMGASDPANVTETVLRAIPPDVSCEVILGARAPHVEAVRRALGPNMRLALDPSDLPERLKAADLVIGAAGSSSFERAVLGKPSLILAVVDNQQAIAQAFAQTGAAHVIAPELLDDPETCSKIITRLLEDREALTLMRERAWHLTDGRGAWRVLCAVAGVHQHVRLRPADKTDTAWLYALQQCPQTRQYARTPDVPSAEDRARWMQDTLSSPDRLLMIIERQGQPAGMIRLDRTESGGFEVSIACHPDISGQGVGRAALTLIRRLVPRADLLAFIDPRNSASLALFRQAGYAAIAENWYRNALS